jgi:glycine/D-amino acid oxidase-like deaminating enzyme
MTRRAGTVVVGGGVVGLCLAGFLAEAGEDVLILDHGHAGGTTSNAGSLHVQMQSRFMRLYPDAVPGMERQLPLYREAVAFWRDLAARLGDDIGLAMTGGLMVAESEEQLTFLAAKAERERRQGLEVEILARADLNRVAPYLGPSIVGAELCADEGKVDPLRANAALARWVGSLGVRIERGVKVHAVERDGDGFRVATDGGPVEAGRVVLAAGWGTGGLASPFGVAIPSRAEPLHMNITEPAEPLIGHLVQHADRMITLKQLASGQVVIGGGWPAREGANARAPGIEFDSMVSSVTLALHVVPALAPLRVLRAWAGNNTVVDGRGVLGPVPGERGLFVAIPGDAGYTLGPLSARMVADAMLGRGNGTAIGPYLPDRFTVALAAR